VTFIGSNTSRKSTKKRGITIFQSDFFNVLQDIKEISLEKLANALRYQFYLKADARKSKDFYHSQYYSFPKFGFR
jgi:hypothetical protein